MSAEFVIPDWMAPADPPPAAGLPRTPGRSLIRHAAHRAPESA